MAEKENTFLTANDIYEEVEGEAGKTLNLEQDQQNNLVGIIKSRFSLSEEARNGDERRWLKSYENYRGLYNKSVKFRESEKSRYYFFSKCVPEAVWLEKMSAHFFRAPLSLIVYPRPACVDNKRILLRSALLRSATRTRHPIIGHSSLSCVFHPVGAYWSFSHIQNFPPLTLS